MITMFFAKLRSFLALFGFGVGDGMNGTLATSQDSIHATLEEDLVDGSGVESSGLGGVGSSGLGGVESSGLGSVMTEALAISQDFYHGSLSVGLGFGGVSSGNGSVMTESLATSQDFNHDKGKDGCSGNGNVMTETLATSQDFNHDKGEDGCDGSKHTGDTDLFEDEEVQDKELPLQEILPGTAFASKTEAVNAVKEFFNNHYHPFVAVRIIMPL